MRKINHLTFSIISTVCLLGAVTTTDAQTSKYKNNTAETALWDILKDSDNPEAFRSYLDIYPNGEFAGDARKLLETTEASQGDADIGLDTADRRETAAVSIPEPPPYQPQGYLGVDVRKPEKGEEIHFDQFEKKGALIAGLIINGPAALAGLRIGDVIVRANGRAINDPGDLVEISSQMAPGEIVTIEFFRDRRRHSVPFPIGDRFTLLWRDAHLGNPSAMYSLFFAFRDGNGPGRNIIAALGWLHQASDAGHVRAHYTLARRYQLGQGVEKDLPRALALFEKSGNAGDGRGMYRAGNMHRWGEGTSKDPATAAVWYRRAIDAGEYRALTALGSLYRFGKGAPKDYHKARKLYRQAVSRNQRGAYLPLARMHLRGQGGPVDADRAVSLLSKAVDLGQTASMVELGALYIAGEKVKRDKALGTKLLRQAAAKGNRNALRELNERNITAYDPLELQKLLAKAGFDPGPLDGKPGKKTRAAIRDFQEDAALKVNGDPSLEVVLALRKRLGTKNVSD